ncbi:MAG: hypothetical protein ACYTDW_09270 [Planctomycetota bacterium]|jgi:hypothetical protein
MDGNDKRQERSADGRPGAGTGMQALPYYEAFDRRPGEGRLVLIPGPAGVAARILPGPAGRFNWRGRWLIWNRCGKGASWYTRCRPDEQTTFAFIHNEKHGTIAERNYPRRLDA